MQSSILGLIVAVMGQVAEPVSETQWTIEEIRKGFEALTTSWQTREIHFVRFPRNVFDAPIDNPDRLEGVVRQSASRQFIVDSMGYQNDIPAGRRYFGFDGERFMDVFYKRPPPPDDPTKAEVKRAEIQGPNDTIRLIYPQALDLYCGRPFLDWLRLPSARVAGSVEIDAASCVRVEVTLPIGVVPVPTGTTPADQEQKLTIDIDPQRDFWPRHYSMIGLRDGKPGDLVCRLSDFRNVDGRWFPFKVNRGDKSFGEQCIITKVVFDLPMTKADFHPKLPDGVRVIDGGRTYITGGQRGEQMIREGVKNLVDQHAGEAVSARSESFWSSYGWHTTLVAVAFVCLVVAVVLRLRR